MSTSVPKSILAGSLWASPLELVHIPSLGVQWHGYMSGLWCWPRALTHHLIPTSDLLPDITTEPALCTSCYCTPLFGRKLFKSTNSELCLTSLDPWMIVPWDWVWLSAAQSQGRSVSWEDRADCSIAYEAVVGISPEDRFEEPRCSGFSKSRLGITKCGRRRNALNLEVVGQVTV